MSRAKRKNKIKTTGYFHPVKELMEKANYEILDKINKYAAPPYIIILLHNAMELMLKDFLLTKNIDKITYQEGGSQKTKDVERAGAELLIQFCANKMSLIKKNYQMFKSFNMDRNTVYHRSALTLRIENIKDYYRLMIALYDNVYKNKFKPVIPSKIKSYMFLALYSFIFTFGSPPLASPYNTIWSVVAVISLTIFSSLSFIYFLKQHQLHRYFTF